MDFKMFDAEKIDEYTKCAKKEWGNTKEYKEYEEKNKNLSSEDKKELSKEFMNIFSEIGLLKELEPDDEKVQSLILKLQNYITEHFYNCSCDMLLNLGDMYENSEEFNNNIDNAGGLGTAKFTNDAIKIFCKK